VERIWTAIMTSVRLLPALIDGLLVIFIEKVSQHRLSIAVLRSM
jgi:hypothetical protein